MEDKIYNFESLTASLPDFIKYRFMQKCNFYDINASTVITNLCKKFVDGEFDDFFDFPK